MNSQFQVEGTRAPDERGRGLWSGVPLGRAPKESITLSIKIDATDQLEKARPLATTIGTSPKLATPVTKMGTFISKAAIS